MNAVDSAHDYYRFLCAMDAVSQTSPEEHADFVEHLKSCSECQHAQDAFQRTAGHLAQDAALLTHAAGSTEETDDDSAERLRMKERIHQTLESRRSARSKANLDPVLSKISPTLWSSVPGSLKLGIAAGLLLLAGLQFAELRIARDKSRDFDHKTRELQGELERLRTELVARNAKPTPPVAPQLLSPSPTDAQLESLSAKTSALEKDLSASEKASTEEAKRNGELQDQIRLLQSSLDVLQASSSGLRTERDQLTAKVSSLNSTLENSQKEVAELTQEVVSRDRSADRNQKLLATDRDLQVVLGARSLRIIDVMDVDGQGETERPFGRIFYTEGKSLIFYAFDLDKQRSLKHGVSFDVWGQKDVKDQPRKLGAFYMNDPAQNRWVLKVDDGKVLSQIGYIFVTDGSTNAGAKPKGRPLLAASLNVTPNHP